jgi:Flp pilus assembly pilin Flp
MQTLRPFLSDETGTAAVDYSVLVTGAVAMGLGVVFLLTLSDAQVNDGMARNMSEDGILVETVSQLDRDVVSLFGDPVYARNLLGRSSADISADYAGLNAQDAAKGRNLLDQINALSFDGTQSGSVGGVDLSTVDDRQALLGAIYDADARDAGQLSEATRAMMIADEAAWRGLAWNPSAERFQ